MCDKKMMFDVTKQVDFHANDGLLHIIKCVCGHKFNSGFILITDNPKVIVDECPTCNRKFYFTHEIHVYEVKDTEEMSQNG